MANKLFIKIWSGLLSSLTLFSSESAAYLHTFDADSQQKDNTLIIKRLKSPDLFLREAKDEYSDSILFAAHRSHRSHSSHRSHYSSRGTYSPPASVSPKYSPPASTPKKITTITITDIKMVQFLLNLLGYEAGKVNGKLGTLTTAAIMQFQEKEDISKSGKIDEETILDLAREAKKKFPDNPTVKEAHTHLLKLYMKLAAP